MQINIQPITIYPYQADAIRIDAVKIRGIGDTGSAIVFYAYVSTTGSPEQTLNNGSIEIPNNIYNQWGTDDTFIIDYVISTLGLTRA
jgi:hypothetical protein